jgi:hypothetical protein
MADSGAAGLQALQESPKQKSKFGRKLGSVTLRQIFAHGRELREVPTSPDRDFRSAEELPLDLRFQQVSWWTDRVTLASNCEWDGLRQTSFSIL